MNGTSAETSTSVSKQDEPIVDIGNLLMIDRDEPASNDQEEGKQPDEDQLKAMARDNTQYLFNQVWALPQHTAERAICVKLPGPIYLLPREKSVPKPHEPTKWEKFAKEKGILSKKTKLRLEGSKRWDDTAKEWKPRYGYRAGESGAGGGARKDWLIEIPDQKDPYKDYFEERNEAKRERMAKQELQRLRNVRRQSGLSDNHQFAPLPPTPKGKGKKSTQNSPLTGANRMQARKIEAKEASREAFFQLTHKVHQAKKATASMGQHEPTMKGERKPKGGGEKRKLPSDCVAGGMDAEKKQQLAILKRIQSKRPQMTQSRFNAAAKAGEDVAGDGDDGGERKGRREKPKGKFSKGRAIKSNKKSRN